MCVQIDPASGVRVGCDWHRFPTVYVHRVRRLKRTIRTFRTMLTFCTIRTVRVVRCSQRSINVFSLFAFCSLCVIRVRCLRYSRSVDGYDARLNFGSLKSFFLFELKKT